MAREYQGHILWDGPTKVVDAHQLEAATMDGWRVIAHYETERPQIAPVEKVFEPDQYGNPSRQLVTEYTGQQREHKFLVGLTRDEELERLRAALETIGDGAREAYQKMVETETERDIVKSDLEAQGRLMDEQSRSFKTLDKRYGEERELRRKLEEDMAKVRKFVGEKAWSEALPKEVD